MMKENKGRDLLSWK